MQEVSCCNFRDILFSHPNGPCNLDPEKLQDSTVQLFSYQQRLRVNIAQSRMLQLSKYIIFWIEVVKHTQYGCRVNM